MKRKRIFCTRICRRKYTISHCYSCGKINFISIDSRINCCRECNTERMKKYRNTEIGRNIINKLVAKSIMKHPRKQKARITLNKYLQRHQIDRPKICMKCHKDKKTEAHHPNYNKSLLVSWLCRQCHAILHRTPIAKSIPTMVYLKGIE